MVLPQALEVVDPNEDREMLALSYGKGGLRSAPICK